MFTQDIEFGENVRPLCIPTDEDYKDGFGSVITLCAGGPYGQQKYLP